MEYKVCLCLFASRVSIFFLSLLFYIPLYQQQVSSLVKPVAFPAPLLPWLTALDSKDDKGDTQLKNQQYEVV